MSKVDITVSRQMTLSPVQFENFKPSVTLTLKDVPIDKIDDIYSNLTNMVDNIFKLELASNGALYYKLKETTSYKDYIVGVEHSKNGK